MLPLVLIGGALVITLFSGMPVVFAIGFVVMVYAAFVWGPESFVVFSGTAFDITSKYTFICIPLFILMAELLIHSGAGRDAFEVANKWIGRLPGGLGVSAEAASALMASVVGISAANSAIIGLVALPEMEAHGYSKRLAAGSIAAGGTLGILIPPSVTFVIYGTITELSIGQLFLAGLIPGLIMAFFFSLWIFCYAVFNPKAAPRAPRFSFSEKIKSLWRLIPLLCLAVFMLIALYTGMATPSEIASVGVVGSIALLLYYRQLTWANVKAALLGTIRTSCMVMWIIVVAVCFGHIMAYIGAAKEMSLAIIGVSENKYVIVLLMVFVLVLMGCFLDPTTMIIITTPIFVPVVQALGFDLIWFGVIFIITMEMGYVTPPFGFNLFVMRSIAPNIPLSDIIIGVLPFIFCMFLTIVVLLALPELALILPRAMI